MAVGLCLLAPPNSAIIHSVKLRSLIRSNAANTKFTVVRRNPPLSALGMARVDKGTGPAEGCRS